MTHYAVVVFDGGKNLEKLLAPYDENKVMKKYVDHEVTVDEWRNILNHYLNEEKAEPYDRNNLINQLTLDEFYKKYGKSWNAGTWKKNAEGKWEEWSSYNPKSRYDYYDIYKEELPDFVPYSFVTPDGVWHSQGRMGWWACSTDLFDDAEWKVIWEKALARHKDEHVYWLDCHI